MDVAQNGAVVRQTHTKRLNADYIHKKKPKRIKTLPAGTLNAVLSMGNPTHPNTRVSLRYDETMGVSVFVAGAPLRKYDYVSFYSVKETLTGD